MSLFASRLTKRSENAHVLGSGTQSAPFRISRARHGAEIVSVQKGFQIVQHERPRQVELVLKLRFLHLWYTVRSSDLPFRVGWNLAHRHTDAPQVANGNIIAPWGCANLRIALSGTWRCGGKLKRCRFLNSPSSALRTFASGSASPEACS